MRVDVTHYLYSQDEDEKIFILARRDIFDGEDIKKRIIEHLEEFPADTLEWCRVSDDKLTVGDDILDFYEVNKGKPCKVILKGSRTFYKTL